MKMIRSRILLKTFAVFFIVEMLVSAIAPGISWALTAGPTAPEATSFEPVDTTDMVNLTTGNLAYNIPLLEVPGPSGGYPLSLSYHAGIQPNEDASWVGLGFSLNPGSLVRNVNGFADDQLNQQNSSRYFWNGGHTDTYSIGVSYGISGTPASVSAGLSFSQDTYQGSGVGMYAGVGVMLGKTGNSGVGLGATIGVSPYGDPYASAGVKLSAPIGAGEKGAAGLSVGIGISTNFKSVEFSGGISAGSLGATISTGSKGVSANVSVAGASVSNNSQSGRLNTSSSGFTIPIPVGYGFWVETGYSYQRYWIDQMDRSKVNGSLYYPDNTAELTSHYFDNTAYDTYSLLDPTLDGGIVDNPNPDKVLGGSFPGFDNYMVHAQGISGYMRPYYFQKHLYKRNNYSTNSDGKNYQTIQYDISKVNPGEGNLRAEFRFINDFSNRFEFKPGQINQNAPNTDQNPLQYNFSNGTDIKIGEDGTNSYTTNQVQGSSSINWFTNKEIVDHSARVTSTGFIETVSTGFERATPLDKTDDSNIGGFTIINQSGVKYHFALPAYSSEEYMYSGNKTGTETFNEFYKGGKYAYTWYLTALTGSDYVDRGPDGTADGKLNEYDWGYWVEFEYGKWTDQYAWRNPSEGMASDLDNNFQNFSTGIKEIYYLDAIRTKSHTALFFKDIRYDGKSTLHLLRNINNRYDSASPSDVPAIIFQKSEKIPTGIRLGGMVPKTETCQCFKTMIVNYPLVSSEGERYAYFTDSGVASYTAIPTSTLKLTSIVLIENASLKNITLSKLGGDKYSQQSDIHWKITSDVDNKALKDQCTFISTINHHLYQNVLDADDLSRSDVKTKALRIIEFDTDETKTPLCPGTANSFDFNLLKGNSPSTNENDYPKFGKLTLTGLKFLGKGGSDLIPPMKFQYELGNPLRGSSDFVNSSGNYLFHAIDSGLHSGDILKITDSASRLFYAVIMSIDGDVHNLKIIFGSSSPPKGKITWQQTKNPPYNKDSYDLWGLYKSDFDQTQNAQNESISRVVTEISAQSLDVWSLRRVTTSTGAIINMDYTSDSYDHSALAKTPMFRIKDVVDKNLNTLNISFWEDIDVATHYKVGDQFDIDIFAAYSPQTLNRLSCTCDIYGGQDVFDGAQAIPYKYSGKGIIMAIDGNTLDVSCEEIYTQLKKETLTKLWGTKYNCTNYSCTYNIPNKWPSYITGGIISSREALKPGGGIAVKSISIESGFRKNTTKYTYANGTTTYEPFGLLPALINSNYPYNPIGTKYLYMKGVFSRYIGLIANTREIPPPGVLYQSVQVSESVANARVEVPLEQHTVYEFEVFQGGDVDIQYTNDESVDFAQKQYDNFVNYSKKETRNVTLKDYTSRIGSLKKISLYDNSNRLISQTTNHYLHDEVTDNASYELKLSSRFKNQGVIEETYSDARFTAQNDADFSLQGVVSKREQYPVIQIGQTTVNYKSGIKTSTSTKAFDFYSGQAIQTISNDGYGNTYLSETTPAYRKYGAMGLAINGGKNMLTQEAASYTYKINPTSSNAKTGLVSASVQTWSDEIPSLMPSQLSSGIITQNWIWRKHASYSFVGDNTMATTGDGLYPLTGGTPPAFNAWNRLDPVPTGWRKNSEITLYDVGSHALEATDINQNYAATKMTFDQSRVLVTGANCEYQELAYSGAEEQPTSGRYGLPVFGGGVHCNGTWTAVQAHTGKYSVKALPGDAAFSYDLRPNESPYIISFWSSQPLATVKYQQGQSAVITATVRNVGKAGNWYLLEATIPSFTGTGQVSIWNEATSATTYFDDFRVHPLDAAVTSYVYNQWGELSHILDNNNLYTEYRYDGMGRLKETYKESFQSAYGNQGVVKVNEFEINYGLGNK